MKKMDMIRGAGGGGKGGGGSARAPVEAADSLRSKQFARVIDLVSEGEIFGLVDGLKSVYLDDTPVQNQDGTYNFTGVTLVTRNGTQSQEYIPGFPSSEAEISVSEEVKAASPVVRSITNANINAARVTLSVPRLTYQDPNTGDISGTSVQIAIDLQANGGGYVEKLTDTISGKTSAAYQRAYRIELTGSPPWDVRVRRITADSAQSNLQNATWWNSYTEIIDAKLRYPNSALNALMVDAQQFRSIQRRGYDSKGILVRIPSNYNPATRVYTGVWDGTFSIAWTNNPAWCFYGLLTSDRYGLGVFLDAAQVDKWALYQIGQYCDEMVPDGFGGTEPRFTCSLYLQTREEAYTVINNFASIFRSMVYWSGGAITAVQDAPSAPVALFTPANVVGGQFSYEGSSAKARHTVALVSWNDPADRYKQKIEYVEDADGIARYGVIQTEVIAIGCTSRGQAHRMGRWLLYTERMETELLSFRAGLEGLSVAPGEVIQTSDPVRAGVRMGGRVLSATVASVTLDASVAIESGKTYTLWAVLPDGTVESRAVTTAPSTTATLAVTPSFTAAPQAMAIWVLAVSDLAPETWRVLSVGEVDATQAQITALAYRADKYAAVEQNLILEPLQTSALRTAPSAPTGATVSESLYLISPVMVGTRVTVAWSGSAQYYELQWRIANGNWSVITTSAPSVDIQPALAGSYEFKLVAINAIGMRSAAININKEIYGLTGTPADVAGFAVIKVGGVAQAQWNLTGDLDVQVGGYIVIRHSPMTSGATWNDGVILDTFDGNTVNGLLPLITGTYMAKALDSSGTYSANAVSFVATEGMVTGFTTVATSTQHMAFSGAKTNVVKVDNVIKLDNTDLFDSAELFDSPDPMDGGNIAATGSYAFDAYLDMGTVATRRFEADLTALSGDTMDMFDNDELFDSAADFDGQIINDCDVTLYAATTNDDPAGSPTWSAWTPFFVADFTCRAAKFKLDFESKSVNSNISVSALTVHAKVAA